MVFQSLTWLKRMKMPSSQPLHKLAPNPVARALLRHEHAHACMAGLRIRVGFDQQGDAVAVDPIGDPGFGAVDHIVAAIGAGMGADGLQIRAAVRLGQRQAAPQLATREAWQEVLLF